MSGGIFVGYFGGPLLDFAVDQDTDHRGNYLEDGDFCGHECWCDRDQDIDDSDFDQNCDADLFQCSHNHDFECC